MNTKDLGPLAFTAEDGSIPKGMNYVADELDMVITIREANRLLAERLGEAPEVFIEKNDSGLGNLKFTKISECFGKYLTHRARLVLIEKL